MTRASRRLLAMLSAAGAGLFAFLLLTDTQAEIPERIVVAGGGLTEIVFALGAGDRVVGVDQTSTHPPEAAGRPQIGYVRRLSPEGVLSLTPDLLIATHDAGPEVAFEQLRAAGVPIARAPHARTAEDIPDKIAFVGETIGKGSEAQRLAAEFSAKLDAVRAKVARLDGQPRVLFILSIQNGAPLVGGRDTTADEMIALAGGANAAAEVTGYKPMSREAILAAAPDAVLMMERQAARLGGLEQVLGRPEIALTPAGREGRGIVMDGMLLLGFGPRTPEAVATLARALHPKTSEAAGL